MEDEWEKLKKAILAETEEKVERLQWSSYSHDSAGIKTFKAPMKQSGVPPCYMAEGIVKVPPAQVFDLWWKHGERSEWDEQLSDSKVLQSLDEVTQVVHSCTHPAAAGLISPRDFVDLLFKQQDPHSGSGTLWFKSVEYSGLTAVPGHVRGWNHASCVVIEPAHPEEGEKKVENEKEEQKAEEGQQQQEGQEGQEEKKKVVAPWCKVKVYSHLDIKMWWLPTAVADPAMTTGLIDTIKGIRKVVEKSN